MGLSEKCGLSDEISALAVYVVFSMMNIKRINRKVLFLWAKKAFIFLNKKGEMGKIPFHLYSIYGDVNAPALSLAWLLRPETCPSSDPLAVTRYRGLVAVQL